ncbi:hypothetical protein TPAU25S_02600 [Tsukamurella paurometabola]
MLTRCVPPVVQVPQFGPLLLRIPLAESVAQREDPLLGAGPLLVTAAAAEHRIEAVLGDRIQQRHRLQRIADAIGALFEPAIGEVVLHRRHVQAEVVLLDHLVAEGQHLRQIVTGVHVQQGEGQRRRPEGLDREVQQHGRVLATGEQDHRTLELAGHLAEDVDRLRLERVEGAEFGARSRRILGNGHEACSPHSVLVEPAQRPLRGSDPGAGFFVQGWHPIDG